MNVALLHPAALAALVALLIPILLHLIRRADYTLTPFAAMRWIAAQLRQQRRLRVRDLPLLLLRLLLIALVAILLAQPVLRGDATAAAHWVLVAPGADVAAARRHLAATDADWRWLAPGFPAVATTAAPPTSDSASLLRELDAELPADRRISVVVPDIVDGLDGARPVLSHAIEWIVVDGAMPARARPAAKAPSDILVRQVDATTRATVEALATAWRGSGWPAVRIDDAAVDAAIPGGAHWLLWLSGERPPALTEWIEAGGIAVASATRTTIDATGTPVWRDADQNVIASRRRIGNGQLIELAGALTPAELPALLDGDFPARLHSLFSGDEAAPTRAMAAALRPLQRDAATATSTAALATRTPLDPWFALLIAALFAVERTWATTRRRLSP